MQDDLDDDNPERPTGMTCYILLIEINSFIKKERRNDGLDDLQEKMRKVLPFRLKETVKRIFNQLSINELPFTTESCIEDFIEGKLTLDKPELFDTLTDHLYYNNLEMMNEIISSGPIFTPYFGKTLVGDKQRCVSLQVCVDVSINEKVLSQIYMLAKVKETDLETGFVVYYNPLDPVHSE